ncbi:MAG: hypothetical protein WB510_00815 [Candidatus Sulfotelmatobacter sp.]
MDVPGQSAARAMPACDAGVRSDALVQGTRNFELALLDREKKQAFLTTRGDLVQL